MMGGGVVGNVQGGMAAAVLGRCCIILDAVEVCPLIPGPIHLGAGIFPSSCLRSSH